MPALTEVNSANRVASDTVIICQPASNPARRQLLCRINRFDPIRGIATSECTLPSRRKQPAPPGFNSLQQQDRFDAFLGEFNAERPHEALGMKCPAELYAASTRRYDGLPELTYPFHDRDVIAQLAGGSVCIASGSTSQPCSPVRSLASRKSTTVFGLLASCIMISGTSTWSRKPYNPLDNPFGTRLSPMS